MSIAIYAPYVSRISAAVQASRDRRSNILNKSFSATSLKEGFTPSEQEFQKSVLAGGLRELSKAIGSSPTQYSAPGAHPHFLHLKNSDEYEHHYITSVFVDIKGSTRLFSVYELPELRIITNTIQLAVIHTCVALGGYIQRLQGDGVFSYFGGKGISKKEATVMALNAASMISFLMEEKLNPLFKQDGIKKIGIRTGIDFGDDKEVLWASYGVGDCSEITTCSLHTSLASKMLQFAGTNGIMVGDNVVKQSGLPEHYFRLPKNTKGDNKKRIIYESRINGLAYKQHDFDWKTYILNSSFIKLTHDGLTLKSLSAPNLPPPQQKSDIKYLENIAKSSKPWLQ